MIFKQLKMEGFLVSRWEHKNKESLKRMLTWMQEVQYKGILGLLYIAWSKYSHTSSEEVSYLIMMRIILFWWFTGKAEV